MLKKILTKFFKSSGFSRTQLSNELNITESMLDEAISQLIRMGYLSETKTSEECDVKCNSCPYAKSCNLETIKFYDITKKGENYINN